MNLLYFFTKKILSSFLLMASFFCYSQEGKYYSNKRNLTVETKCSAIFVSGGTIIYGKENVLKGKIYTEEKQSDKPNKTLAVKKKKTKYFTQKLVQKKTYPREKSQVFMVNRDTDSKFKISNSKKSDAITVVNNRQIGLAVMHQIVAKRNALQKPILLYYEGTENASVTDNSFSIRPPPFCLA